MPTPLLGVVESEQDLRHGDAMTRQSLLIGMGELDLAGGGGGLLLLQPQLAAVEAETAAADGDGAGGHDQHFLTALPTLRHIVAEGIEPVAADGTGRLIDQ
jgi:hypothetical protein